MGLMTWIARTGRKIGDGLVGVTSGSTQIKTLDTPNAFRFIAVVAIVGLGFSGWLVLHAVRTLGQPPAPVNTNTEAVAVELKKLETIDTDGDGISDYDELYQTKTSPYLSDSDSDTIGDRQELTSNTDPNCPQGKICTGIDLNSAAALDTAALRQALRASGVSQTILDSTDDATLRKIYDEVVAQQGQTNGNTNSSLTVDNLQNLTPAEIRKLLVDSGVDAATLQTVDDATLKNIFQQAIDSQE